MSNVHEFPDIANIEEQAGAWIIKLDSETPLSSTQRQAFSEWMSRSPAHRDVIKELAQFWGKMNVLTDLAIPTQLATHQPAGNSWLISFKAPWARAAYALTITVAIVLGLWTQFAEQNQLAEGLYATAVGQQKAITLADGSLVQLNTNSQIRVDFNRENRDIWLLQGEAHFDVAKNPKRPFRVAAGHGRVEAIGTAFGVYLNGNNIDVTVTEGRVELQAIAPIYSDTSTTPMIEQKPLVQINAGQGVRLKNRLDNSSVAQASPADIEATNPEEIAQRLNWRSGFIVFDGTPLNEVVAEVSRYTLIHIELTDPALHSLKIGGQFKVGEMGAMLESLENNFGIQVKRVAYNHIQLSLAKD